MKSILLTVRNFSDKTCGKKENIRFMLNDFLSQIVLLVG